jgi:hypothetical protein
VKVEVTYHGPSGCYSAECDGEWFELIKGTPLNIPEPLAESLLDVEGHTFTIGDEVPVETPDPVPTTPLAADSGSGSGSGDDPLGVNATSSYGGGS